MKLNQKSLSVVMSLFAAASVLGLTGCEQNYSLKLTNGASTGSKIAGDPPIFNGGTNPGGSANPGGSTGPTSDPGANGFEPHNNSGTDTPGGVKTAVAIESFSAATNEVKKIDFLFVVDNSGSMSDNQKKLARGFQAFANTFYRRADLDICTMIITSDRYLGKTGDNGYARERTIPCTKPAGSDKWTPEQMRAHIDNLIEEFQQKIYVGVYGSGSELLGKSLVTYLNGMEKWGDSADGKTKSSFFRKDAVANISFVTDENNFFYRDPTLADSVNDLPAVKGAAIPNAAGDLKDSRQGIKEYVDQYFASVNPGRAATYSVTSILELNRSPDGIPGIATNLNELVAAVGRESTKSDISGSVEAYTDVYQSIADAIVLRATTFNLAHAVYSDLAIRIRRSDNTLVMLNAKTDVVLNTPTQLSLSQSVLPLLRGGDRLEVAYRYLVP